MWNRGSSPGKCLVLFDSLNILLNSCMTARPHLDLTEAITDLMTMASAYKHVSLAVCTNRDLFPDQLTESWYREAKNSEFDLVFEVQRNMAGYSAKDVHGQLNVI